MDEYWRQLDAQRQMNEQFQRQQENDRIIREQMFKQQESTRLMLEQILRQEENQHWMNELLQQQLERQQWSLEEWRYWNDSVYGFWAWMKRQEEEYQWKSQESAKLAFESWLRQEERTRAYQEHFNEYTGLESPSGEFQSEEAKFEDRWQAEQQSETVRRQEQVREELEAFFLQEHFSTGARLDDQRHDELQVSEQQDETARSQERRQQELENLLYEDSHFSEAHVDQDIQRGYQEQIIRYQEQNQQAFERVFRQAEWAREEWKAQRERQQWMHEEYDYWWHPTQGFWAWMKRQEDEYQYRSLENAKFAFEAWQRQQELTAELENFGEHPVVELQPSETQQQEPASYEEQTPYDYGYSPEPQMDADSQYEYREYILQYQEQNQQEFERVFRQAEWAREEWRAQAERQQWEREDYDYWWHPIQGFWAWMKRQEEEYHYRSLENAKLAFESWRRQQELAEVISRDSSEVARHHDELIQLETLSAYPKLEDHSHGRLNREFMDEMLSIIAAERASGREHPLEKLLSADRDVWRSRRADSDEPTVQAGHLISRHSGREERFALEDSTYNQLSSNRGETQGAIFLKDAVDIGGIPVERRTAEMWEKNGLLPQGTVENAQPHPGWTSSRDIE